MALAEFIKTIIATLSGIIIVRICDYLKIKSETQKQVSIKKADAAIEFEKTYIIKPILDYLDSELKYMVAIYNEGLSTEKAEDVFKPTHRLNLPCISARIRALKDKSLNEKFDTFSTIRFDIAHRILTEPPDRHVSKARKHLDDAEQLAGDIFATIKEHLFKN